MPEYDEAMVERLAALIVEPPSDDEVEEAWLSEIDEKVHRPKHEEAALLARFHARRTAVRILTALSQDYAIVAKAEYEAIRTAAQAAEDVKDDVNFVDTDDLYGYLIGTSIMDALEKAVAEWKKVRSDGL